ncbi:MAG: hypothetical protein EA398_14275 [Deltaproteobacteria bacterium]|nr:MAG: hypothetical protein EA398_14275 [Deltaproteobacteria bacterium]
MRITATYGAEELFRFLAQIFPLDVQLGEDGDTCRKVRLHPPATYRMAPGEGVRLKTDAELFWPVPLLSGGFRVPQVEATVLPSIDYRDASWHLVFRVRIDDFDLALLPDAVEALIASRLSDTLERAGVEVAWNYADTLSVDIDLPGAVTPPRQFRLRADEGLMEITADGLRIDAPLHLAFVRLQDPRP